MNLFGARQGYFIRSTPDAKHSDETSIYHEEAILSASALQLRIFNVMDMSIFADHLHTPPHLFIPNSIYFVTGATINKQRFLEASYIRSQIVKVLFAEALRNDWELQAWAVLDNHYHFIAKAPEDATTLTQLVRAVHSRSAKFINRRDQVEGRRVWYNYWDSCITSETSYLARLHYVIMNPVKHGHVEKPEDYLFSSYRWFVETAKPKFQQLVFSQPIDRLNLHDNF